MTQEEINDMVQRNVDHLEIILAYTEPDVVGDSSDKTTIYNSNSNRQSIYTRE
jgi:hypothetical protein